MRNLTIGELAREAEVNIETIRYYERRGLVPEPSRSSSGYRQYSLEAIARIQFIKHAKELGFSLKEILDLLSLRVDPDTTCADVKRMAEAKIEAIERKISSLLQMEEALAKLKAECDGNGPVGECPILEALETKKRR